MASCSCGAGLEGAARYCSRCGSPVPSAGPPGLGATPADGAGTLLLGDEADPQPSDRVEGEVRGRSRPSPVWLGIVALAVAALGWSLFRSGPAEPRGAVGSELGDTVTDTSEVERAGADEDDSVDEPRDVAVSSEDDVGGDAAEEATEDGGGGGADDALPGGPVVGEETGLRLLIGSDSGRPAQLLDLDTGELSELDRVRGAPMEVVGSRVVMAYNGQLSIVDLTDLELAPVAIAGSEVGWAEFFARDGDRILVVLETRGEPELWIYELDGTQVEELEIDLLNFRYLAPSSTDLFQSPDGGIYARSGTDFRQVAAGALRAVGDEIALVSHCDEAFVCRSRWYDRRTWQVRDDLPSVAYETAGWASVGGGDRWLFEVVWNHRFAAQLTSVATGEVTRTWESVPPAVVGPGLSAPISDDGRWLFDAAASDGAVIVDLADGTEWPVDLGPGFRPRDYSSIGRFLPSDG